MKNAIVLLSGGLDSATCAAIAKSKGYSLYAMSFKYGQRHDIELNSALKIAKFLNIKKHKIIEIDLGSFGGSALTDKIEVPKNRDISTDEIPVTYVPARNTIFLSYALAWAEVLKCNSIFIGVNSVDYSGYPDCRPEYIKAFQTMANLATKAGVEGQMLQIQTPLIDLTKSQIIKKGVELGFDYSLTHSCYSPTKNGISCGECDSCILRKKGFEDAGLTDPIMYAS